MEGNDFWTFVGLVVGAFVAVVAPKMFQPGHTGNTVTFLAGGTTVLVVAFLARWRSRRQIHAEASRTSEGDGP